MKANGFLALDHDFIRSPEMAALSAKGKLLIFGMTDRYNGRNNGKIPYSAREVMRWLSCGPATALRALDELEQAGLITATRRGSFADKSGARKKEATTWRLNFLRPSKGDRHG